MIFSTWKMIAPTWNDKFDLPDGSCSVSDIQHYFEYNLKDMENGWQSFSKNICK